MKNLSELAIGLLIASIGAVGCASSLHTGNAGTDGAAPGTTVGGDGGVSPINIGDGSVFQGGLTITPSMPVVTVVTGQPVPTVQFVALAGGTKTGAVWSIDRGELGAIDNNGLFTPVGTIGGTGNVTASSGGQSAQTTVTVNIQTTQIGDPAWSSPLPAPGPGGYGGVGGDGPGGPASPAQVTALAGAPTADASVSWLYPYDGTVWPQGLLPPLVQWDPGAHTFDAAYLHIQENGYEYKGYFAANAKKFQNLLIPKSVWDALTVSNGGDPVTVSLVFLQGSAVFGPYTEAWTIAHATLQGAIYYHSYGTSLVTNSATDGLDNYGHQYGAATLAIAPGATSPTLTAGINSINPAGDGTGCRVCHTVSANGKTLVTQASDLNPVYSRTVTINLANDTTAGAGTSLQTGNLAFPALFKDGSLLLSSSGGMINGDNPTSQLYALPAGTRVPGVTGLPTGLQAALPAFSPDGQHVSFNFWGGSFSPLLQGDQISLALMDFDGMSTFSNPRILYKPTPMAGSGRPTATFSSFLPDSAGVVFDLELNSAAGWAYTWKQNTSELWWVDVATGSAHRLDQLNGYDKTGKLYLPGAAPHSAAQDATLNYEPTVCPIAGGGYAWVVFTSRRMYGNVAQIAPWQSDPRTYPWRDQVTTKKLWVAAVDLNSQPGTDPSHPAFYLPAQELHAGNARGFWTFDVCRPEGQSCGSGAQCCGGYCQGSNGQLTCTANVPKCSNVNDKCTKSSDCCGVQQGITCVNSVCSQSHPT